MIRVEMQANATSIRRTLSGSAAGGSARHAYLKLIEAVAYRSPVVSARGGAPSHPLEVGGHFRQAGGTEDLATAVLDLEAGLLDPALRCLERMVGGAREGIVPLMRSRGVELPAPYRSELGCRADTGAAGAGGIAWLPDHSGGRVV